MNVISGPAIADHCDYDFGDQAGVVGQVLNAFMKDANTDNIEFITFVNQSDKDVLTLFIDNIRLYNMQNNLILIIFFLTGLSLTNFKAND